MLLFLDARAAPCKSCPFHLWTGIFAAGHESRARAGVRKPCRVVGTAYHSRGDLASPTLRLKMVVTVSNSVKRRERERKREKAHQSLWLTLILKNKIHTLFVFRTHVIFTSTTKLGVFPLRRLTGLCIRQQILLSVQ